MRMSSSVDAYYSLLSGTSWAELMRVISAAEAHVQEHTPGRKDLCISCLIACAWAICVRHIRL